MLSEDAKDETLIRLKRIAGQVRGIEKMVEEKRYCIEVLDQIAAVKKALDAVGMSLVKSHVETCVAQEIRSGGGKKIGELVDTLGRWIK